MAAARPLYFEFVQECERLIREFRLAQHAGDRDTMGHTYMALLERVQPILIREARRLADISDGAVREALDGMTDRLWGNLTSPTFPTMESQFGAYLRSMPIRIVRKVSEKYRPSDVSLRIENLDAPADTHALPKSELIADPQSQATLDRLAARIDLEAALAQLPAEERQVAAARLAGAQNNEIARALGVSPATATRIYQRAESRLASLLHAYSERGAP